MYMATVWDFEAMSDTVPVEIMHRNRHMGTKQHNY
jgi:hypothetical protein